MKSTAKIYESPDKGETIYKREPHKTDKIKIK